MCWIGDLDEQPPWVPSHPTALRLSAYHQLLLMALAGVLGFPPPCRLLGCHRPPAGISHLPQPLAICEGSRRRSETTAISHVLPIPTWLLFWGQPLALAGGGHVLPSLLLPVGRDTGDDGTGQRWGALAAIPLITFVLSSLQQLISIRFNYTPRSPAHGPLRKRQPG